MVTISLQLRIVGVCIIGISAVSGCASLSRQKPEIKAFSVQGNGIEQSMVDLRVEEFQSKKIHPLLNYVFFEKNADDLPSRYLRISEEQAAAFRSESLVGLETLDAYYHVLNIIGQRLRSNATAKVRLVGCNADEGKEANNKELSKRRAVTVQKYFSTVWKIDSTRFTIESRNLPQKASSSKAESETADAENRRVEIYADWNVLQPLVTQHDMMRETTPAVIRFYCKADAKETPSQWALTAKQRGKQIYELLTPKKILPSSVDWHINTKKGSIPLDSVPVSYYLTVDFNDIDILNRSSKEGFLSVQQVTLKNKYRERHNDIEKDRYSLILFDFGSDQLAGTNQKIIELIKSENRITSKSKVIITGFTDLTGSEDANKNLALRRAEAVALALKGMPAKEVTVANKTAKRMLYPPYESALPEERLHSRTVIIQVETPIEIEGGN